MKGQRRELVTIVKGKVGDIKGDQNAERNGEIKKYTIEIENGAR